MDRFNDKNIIDWDESDVHAWLTSIGYPQYEAQLREHNILGDVLCLLDAESLKAIGISTIGQRLAILKAVYQVKLAHNIPIDSDHYIPPSEAFERQENVITVEKLHVIVKDQGQRLTSLEDENRRLNESLQLFLDDFNKSQGRTEDSSSPLRRQPSFKWAQFSKPQPSPTKSTMIESPQPSPSQLEHTIPYSRNNNANNNNLNPQPYLPSAQVQGLNRSSNASTATTSTLVDSPRTTQASSQKDPANGTDLKSFKVSLEDPTWKVLPAALKKYRINNDNWQNYAMFICYGSTGNRIERCLSYDEKPLLLFQKLKDARKNPVFMLKHIKDIRSPIAVAQQKHAARKASSVISTGDASIGHGTPGTTAPLNTGKTDGSKSAHRPPRLEVSDFSNPGGAASGSTMLSAASAQGGWPDMSVTTPSMDGGLNGSNDQQGTPHVLREQSVPQASGVSYAVAIYPYMAEQDDEFDVVVGDTFVILSRARGWWVVQRDPTGSGIVDTDTSKQGWVPAGCLLETNVPVASAIEQATAAASHGQDLRSDTPVIIGKTPILPLSIISTSFPGVALMDYVKKGEEELDLIKDDALRVFKRYNHWSYAVKEDGGDRGWVPSWFIGKVNAGPQTPSSFTTPQTSGYGSSLTAQQEEAIVSPMSSAFPSNAGRTPLLT